MGMTYALLIDDFAKGIFENDDELEKLTVIRHVFEICGHDLIVISKELCDDHLYKWYYYDTNTWRKIVQDKMGSVSVFSPFIDDVIIGRINNRINDPGRNIWYADIKQLVVDKSNLYKNKESCIVHEDYNFINVMKLCINNSGAMIRRADYGILIDHLILTNNVKCDILGALIKCIIDDIDYADDIVRGNHEFINEQIEVSIECNHQPMILITDDQFSDNEFMHLLGFYIRKTPDINYMIGVIRSSSFIQQDVMIETIGLNAMNQWEITGNKINVKFRSQHMLYLSDDLFLDDLISRGIKVTGCTSCKLYDFVERYANRNGD